MYRTSRLPYDGIDFNDVLATLSVFATKIPARVRRLSQRLDARAPPDSRQLRQTLRHPVPRHDDPQLRQRILVGVRDEGRRALSDHRQSIRSKVLLVRHARGSVRSRHVHGDHPLGRSRPAQRRRRPSSPVSRAPPRAIASVVTRNEDSGDGILLQLLPQQRPFALILLLPSPGAATLPPPRRSSSSPTSIITRAETVRRLRCRRGARALENGTPHSKHERFACAAWPCRRRDVETRSRCATRPGRGRSLAQDSPGSPASRVQSVARGSIIDCV